MRRPRWLTVVAAVGALALLATACRAADDGATRSEDELVIGFILPQTGSLAFLGPPMIQGVRMAVAEMEEAGGPGDLPIRVVDGDEAGDAAVASETADRLLGEGVHAIIGAAASGMTRAIIDQVTGAGVVQCSPSNTSAEFTTWDDDGYYFRTAPPDVLQGQILAETVLGDNHERVAILARGDGYGRGLAESTAENLEAGGAQVVVNEIYDPDATTFDAEVSTVRSANPDATVLVTFEEGVQLIQGLLEAGITPNQLYGVDGNRSAGLNESVNPGNPNVLDGMKGTAPDPGAVEGFIERLQAFAPDLTETLFAAQSYDCAMLIGLALVAGGSTDPRSIRDNIVALSQGDTECTGFQECAQLLGDGQTISYKFVSGTRQLADAGEPVNGIYEVWEWRSGALESIDKREISTGD